MDISQLRYFSAVSKHGSFSAAAKALDITQPGLTKAVRRLEKDLGCKLLVRLPRGVTPNLQGKALLRHSNLIEVQLKDARDEITAIGSGAVGILRVGAGPSWLSRVLPRIIAGMSVTYPGLGFHVVGGFNGGLMDALRNGDLDLVVSALPDFMPRGLQSVRLTSDTLSVVARKDHPLQKAMRLLPSSTKEYTWALPGRDVLSRSRLDALFQVAGLEPPKATVESDSLSFIAAALRDSDMLSFATSQVVQSEMAGIQPLNIPELKMTRSAGVMFRSSGGVSATMTVFIDAIKKIAQEFEAN